MAVSKLDMSIAINTKDMLNTRDPLHIMCSQMNSIEQDIDWSGKAIRFRVMRCHPDYGVAISERNACKVPKSQLKEQAK